MHKDRENAVRQYLKDTLGIDSPTEDQMKEHRHEWAKKNPDWNKCCVVPVEIAQNTSSGMVTSVSHDLSLTSARLVRGTKEKPIQVQVFYTRVASAD